MDWDAVFELERVEAERRELLAALPEKLGYPDAEALCIALMNAAYWDRKRQVGPLSGSGTVRGRDKRTKTTRKKGRKKAKSSSMKRSASTPRGSAPGKKAGNRKKNVGAKRSKVSTKKKPTRRTRTGRS